MGTITEKYYCGKCDRTFDKKLTGTSFNEVTGDLERLCLNCKGRDILPYRKKKELISILKMLNRKSK